MVSMTSIFALECLIFNIINYIYGNPLLFSLLKNSFEILEVIVTLNAFLVNKSYCFLMCITLGNFELLCKCSYLHFIIILTKCSNDNSNIISQVVYNNFWIIDALLQISSIFIKAHNKTVSIIFNFSRDDKILCLITSLEKSSSN